MRKKLFAAGAAFCMLGMTGCSNDMVEEGGTQAGKQAMMTLQGTTDGPQTRADYTDDNTKMNFSWRNADEISVMVSETLLNDNCKLTTTGTGKSASFSGTVFGFNGTKNIYAFYPYNSTNPDIINDDNPDIATANLRLPNPQLYTVGGAISNSFLVGVGTATASGNAITATASLKQVMSIIKLNITGTPNKVTGVKLKCTDAVFATAASVKLSDATITSLGNLVNELAMTVTDGTTGTDKAVSFAMFPTAELSGKDIDIEVTFNDGTKDIVKSITKKGVDFVRNMHYVMAFDAGITWAFGNLVANGRNNAKIGASTDTGLYFQFGSLIGWNGGNTGTGTGTATDDFTFTATVVPTGYTGNTGSWDQNWKGDLATENASAGTGDPCKYYLKDTWRLPTKDEYVKLFENNGYPHNGPWKWENSSATNNTSGLTFPASGSRSTYNGNLQGAGIEGCYWSASHYDADKGYSLFFNSYGSLDPDNVNKAYAYPVRCVKD